MFESSRPRVPSKATLRILYQLAYISSGTAVGVATLCAEERRRRTQLMQKIADNARCIRQSPRHVQNATAAVAIEGNEHLEHWDLDASPRLGGQSRKKRRETAEWSARAAHLPSRIQAGYEQVVESHGRWSNKSKNAVIQVHEPNSAKGRTPHRNVFLAPAMNAKPSPSYDHARMDARNDMQMKRATAAVSSWEHSTVDLAVRQYRRKGNKLAANVTSNELASYSGVELLKDHTEDNLDPADERFEQGAANLSHDVAKFFRDPSLLSQEPDVRIEHSSRLLLLALHYGTLSEVRSLYLWRLRIATISDDNIRDICEACRSMSLCSDHEYLLDFYEELFVSPRFMQMPGETKVYCALMVHIDSIWWDIRGDDHCGRLRRGLLHGSPQEIKSAFGGVCDQLLRDKRLGDAVSLISPVHSHLVYLGQPVDDLCHVEDRIFSSALSTGQLWYCTEILNMGLKRMSRKTVDDRQFRFIQDLLGKAYQSKHYEPVANLLEQQTSIPFLERVCHRLDDSQRICLAIACAKANTDCQKLWEMLYENIPALYRDKVNQARTVDKLRETWRTTHNLDLTYTLFDQILDWIGTNCQGDRQLSLTVLLTMVEILNNARKPELALRLLERINEFHAHSSHSLSMTAVTLAKKGSWKEVHQLMDILGRWGKFTFDEHVSRTFNKLLTLYSARHTADETWGFVTGLMATLKYKPNLVAKMIMLRCFIVTQALHMIPRWLRLLKAVRNPLIVDSDLAASLLMQYYHEHRPPHVLMFWFSRQLVKNAPSLESAGFIGLIKDSIGYDLRKDRNERHQLKAHQNLALLERAQGHIPAPVNSLKDALRFKGRRDAIENLQHHLESTADDINSYTSFADEPVRSEGAISSAIDSPKNDEQLREDFQLRSEIPIPQVASIQHQYQHAPTALSGDAEKDWDNVLHNLNAAEETKTDKIAFLGHAYHPLGGPEEEKVSSSARNCFRQSSNMSESSASADDDITVNYSVVPGPTTFASTEAPTDASVASVGHMHDPDEHPGTPISTRETFDEKQLERDMILALSLEKYEKVLRLYRRRVATSGVPSSNIALQVAVQASLWLHKGDRYEAEEIIGIARAAGINVVAAVDQLLMQQVWTSSSWEKRDYNNLRTTVIEYYRMNEGSGLRVNHHLGLTAANVMINNHRPQHGLNLLDSIYKSAWVLDRPFTIAAMTIYLKGFAAVESRAGVRWVITTVLKDNMRIDQRFLDTLRSSAVKFGSGRASVTAVSDMAAAKFVDRIRQWRKACVKLRQEQRQQSKRVGWQTVGLLETSANALRSTLVQSSTRKQIEEALLGKAEQTIPSDATKEELEAQQITALRSVDSGAVCDRAIADMKSVLYIHQDSPSKCQEPRPIDDEDWLNQYRLILQQRLIVDGRPAFFRYKLYEEDWIHEDKEPLFEEVVGQVQVEDV